MHKTGKWIMNMFPNEIFQKIIQNVESADDMCQLAGVGKGFYKLTGKDFKRLCFNNLIYRLPDEMWSAAFSQAIDRAWTEPWSDRPKMRWCKESGRIACFSDHRVLIINLDFSRPFSRWITLEGRPMDAELSNKGRYLCVTMVFPPYPELTVYSVQTGKVILKKKMWRIDWVPGQLVGVIHDDNKRYFFNTDTLETHEFVHGFRRWHQTLYKEYKTDENHYMISSGRNRRNFYVTDVKQGDMYTIPRRYTINTEFEILTVTDTLIIQCSNRAIFYDFKAKKVVLSFNTKDYKFWSIKNKNMAVFSNKEVVIVNEKTHNFALLPITFTELLTKDNITYQHDRALSCNLEELMYVYEGREADCLSRPRPNQRLIFADVEKCGVTIRWFDQRPSTTSHPFHDIIKNFETQTLPKGLNCL